MNKNMIDYTYIESRSSASQPETLKSRNHVNTCSKAGVELRICVRRNSRARRLRVLLPHHIAGVQRVLRTLIIGEIRALKSARMEKRTPEEQRVIRIVSIHKYSMIDVSHRPSTISKTTGSGSRTGLIPPLSTPPDGWLHLPGTSI